MSRPRSEPKPLDANYVQVGELRGNSQTITTTALDGKASWLSIGSAGYVGDTGQGSRFLDLLAEAQAFREIAAFLIEQPKGFGWLPGPFTASSELRDRGLLAPHLYSPIRRRSEEWSAPSLGSQTDPDQWALACLFMALECEDEARSLKQRTRRGS